MTVDKDALRYRCWEALRESGAARFPGVEGRIPNFIGAEKAAERLTASDVWGAAEAIKCNPDAPQRAVRHAALRAGKLVYMAVPRLANERPFIAVDPRTLDEDELWDASSIKGADELGELVSPDEMDPIDLIVTGCVGVAPDGARLGKGGGYSDLEYALLRAYGLVDEETPIVTTVHDSQVLGEGDIPMQAHDISLDWIFTPTRVLECKRPFDRPSRVYWDELDEQQIEAIPVLHTR